MERASGSLAYNEPEALFDDEKGIRTVPMEHIGTQPCTSRKNAEQQTKV